MPFSLVEAGCLQSDIKTKKLFIYSIRPTPCSVIFSNNDPYQHASDSIKGEMTMHYLDLPKFIKWKEEINTEK